MAKTKSKTKWIVAIVVILLIAIGIYLYLTQTSPVDKQIIQAADLTKLSQQDLATYNSLPNDAAKADFLRILVKDSKIPDFGIQQIDQANNNTQPKTPPSQGYNNTLPNYKPDAVIPPLGKVTGIAVIDNIINLFRKPHYKQVKPIDDNGCDANGYDSRGVACTKISSYIQVAPIDENGCDALGNNAIGIPCNF